MAHALAMRATSFAASAALLGLMVLIAMSATYVVRQQIFPETTIITSVPEPPPVTPDEPIADETQPPLQNFVEDDTALPTLTPLDTATDAEPTTTFPTDAGPATITDPRWLERPSNLARYYPRRALAREMEGVVMLDCMVGTSGRLACSVISETPRGWAFGEAALRIAADHRMAPAMRDGAPVQGRYRMRVPFELN
jgi:protein TonB